MMLIGLEPGSRYGQSRDVRNHLSIKFLGSTFDSAETILNIPVEVRRAGKTQDGGINPGSSEQTGHSIED